MLNNSKTFQRSLYNFTYICNKDIVQLTLNIYCKTHNFFLITLYACKHG